MKHSVRILAAVLATVLALSLTSFAGDFTVLADELNEMGMFRGTNKGYELDTVPSRGQAAVMLVRLLGQEAAAQAGWKDGTLTHPYVDAQIEWVAPAVAYLYAHGLTNGMGSNAKGQPVFGLQNPCNAQMYCTFLLRALGYRDTGTAPDFSYANALVFAESKGIVENTLLAGGFTRDELVASSYEALGTPVCGSQTLLLEKLIAEGAINGTAAADSLAKMRAWRRLSDACDALMRETMLDLSIGADVVAGSEMRELLFMMTNIQYAGGSTPRLACSVYLTDGTSELSGGQWYRDGWLYELENDGTASKVKTSDLPFRMDELTSESLAEEDCLYMFDTCTVSDDGLLCVFTMSPRFYSLIDNILVSKDLGIGGTPVDVELEISYKDDGTLSSAVFFIDFGTSESDIAELMSCQIGIFVNAVGDQVTIEFPEELDAFPETIE